MCALAALAVLGASALSVVAAEDAHAYAGFDVPQDWAYAPDGLAVGDTFRLLFTPSVGHSFTDAKMQGLIETSNIFTYGKTTHYRLTDDPTVQCYGYYGQMVSSDVYWNIVERNNNGEGTNINKNGGDYCYHVYKRTVNVLKTEPSPLRELHDHFRVLHFGHSDRDDVRSHTYTEGAGVPIYWVGGDRIADNYNDFYAGGTPGESDGSRNEHGKHSQSVRYSYGISPLLRIVPDGDPLMWPPVYVEITPGFPSNPRENQFAGVDLVPSGHNFGYKLRINYIISQTGEFLNHGAGERSLLSFVSGANLPIALTDDTVDEPDGTVTVKVLPGYGYTVGDPSSITISVRDNDPGPHDNPQTPPPPPQKCTPGNPCISMNVLDKSSFEGDNVMVGFDIEPYRSGVSPYTEPGEIRPPGDDSTIAIKYTTHGQALTTNQNGETRTLAAYGSSFYDILPTTTDCNPNSGSRNEITFELLDGPGYQIKEGTATTKTITLGEAGSPAVYLDVSAFGNLTVTEGTDTGTDRAFKTRYTCDSADITVNFNVAQTGDVVRFAYLVGDQTLDIPAGRTHKVTGSSSVVNTHDDNIDEVDGTITYTILPGSGYRIAQPSTITFTVLDNDSGPLGSGSPPPPTTVSIGISSGGSEGDPVSFSIGAAPHPLQSPLPVNVTLSDTGNVLNASDVGWRIVEIPLIGSYTLEVPTINDGVIDVNNVTLTINPGAGYTPGQFVSWTVDVQDAGTTSSLMQPPVYDKLTQAQNLTAVAIDPALVANVTAMASQTQHGDAHVERWSRVLAAFGYITHDNPTTAAEARANAEKYSSPLWPLIADVLTLLEAAAVVEQDDPQTPPDVPTEPDTPPAIDPALINSVRELAAQTQHGDAHVDRWNRVLAAFGEIDHSNPMTAAEAQTNAEKYSSPLWPQIAKVLTQLESR